MGRIYHRLEQASVLELTALKENNYNDALKLRVAELLAEASEIFETLPQLDYLESLPLSVGPDVFFEGLVLSVKNQVLSKQSYIFRMKKIRKTMITERIRLLKKNLVDNYEEIYRYEAILNNIIEGELKDELLHYKKFERLNNEKITPHFMKLAAIDSTTTHSLEKICKDTSDDFDSTIERDNFIVNFYETLYEKPIGPERDGDCITEFLGDVLEHRAVEDSKITQADRDRLDSNLSIDEFDQALKEIKSNTSPGIDGISNRFIKKFWTYFRIPLFQYANYCLDKGELTDSFRSAKVRLIPKKGDPKKIANWRPISLLNCFYKLISRVLTRRLRTVMDRITCVGQKGYSSKKFSQEVLISVLDKIHNARKLNGKGCILSLDIKKAFDSLSHNFIELALRFFNFGDRFIG
jgi:hypothetical protein